MAAYIRPTTLDEALEALGTGPLTILAGGTDHYPARVGRPLDEDVLDVSAIGGLGAIEELGGHWRLGATATWSDVIEADLPPCFDGLKLAAREVGGVQIQNAGTVAGNVCNASPAADGVPPLLTLEAAVEVRSRDGAKDVPLAHFIAGNRRTVLEPGEMVTALLVPKPESRRAVSHFLKLGSRKYLVISIVMAAAAAEIADNGTIVRARVAVGACSEVAQRLPALEDALAGSTFGAGLGEIAEAAHLTSLDPIDDVRGSTEYRRDAALTLVRRTLDELAAGT
jgi:CO/xanthine dehydrogenase FAD-binding subunit